MSRASVFGPGPRVMSRDPETGLYICKLPDGALVELAGDELANVPVPRLPVTYGNTGNIASWPSAEIAEMAQGAVFGQLLPIRINEIEGAWKRVPAGDDASGGDHVVVVLADNDGSLIRGVLDD